MRTPKALAGYEITSVDWRGRSRARRITTREAVKRELVLCAFCFQEWCPPGDITCSPVCRHSYRRQQSLRARKETLTFPKEVLL